MLIITTADYSDFRVLFGRGCGIKNPALSGVLSV